MSNLLPAMSQIWAAIASLEPEQTCVSCLDWGGVENTAKILKKKDGKPCYFDPIRYNGQDWESS